MRKSIENELTELFEEMDEITQEVFDSMSSDDFLRMDFEEFMMIQQFMNIIKKTKEVSLLMAKKMDRQEEILERLDQYLDYKDSKKIKSN